MQVFFKGTLDKTIHLIMWLQVVKSLSIYKVHLPASLQIFISELRAMVDFETISVTSLIQIVYPDFQIGGSQSQDQDVPANIFASGFSNSQIYINMVKQFGAPVVIALLVGLLFKLIMLHESTRKKIIRRVRKWSRGFFWNGAMRTASFAYLNQCIYLLVQATDDSPWTLQKYLSIFLFADYLVGFPLLMVYLQRVNKKYLSSPKLERRIYLLFVKPRLVGDWLAVNQYPFFLARRFVFVFIVLLCNSVPALQIQLLILHQCFYIIVLDFPRADRKGRLVELLNEFILIVLFYHMACFTAFLPDRMVQHQLSYSFLSMLALGVLINLYFLFKSQVRILFLKVVFWFRLRRYYER